MENKEIELLFGEDVRAKVEELLEISLSEEEITKSFSTTSGTMLEEKLQEAAEVRKAMQDESFKGKLVTTITNHILSTVGVLYRMELDKEPVVRRKIIKYTAIDSLNCSEIAMQAIFSHSELKQIEEVKKK